MIELRNVSLKYDGSPVLSNINYIFGRNDFTCVIGKNGSGKSTLLRAAAGLSSYEGSILLNGAEIRSLQRRERAKCLSYLPQSRPVPVIDVGTLIAHGRYPHLGYSKTLGANDRERIKHAVSVTGVEGLLDRGLSTLSGGERQRAYIAMMIAQDADIMLLDEPVTHLDIEYQLEVMELLKNLHQNGKCIVMAAHDLPQAFSYATRVIFIADGGIAATGKPDDLCENPVIKSAFGMTIKKAVESDELYSYRIAKGV